MGPGGENEDGWGRKEDEGDRRRVLLESVEDRYRQASESGHMDPRVNQWGVVICLG